MNIERVRAETGRLVKVEFMMVAWTRMGLCVNRDEWIDLGYIWIELNAPD